MLAATIPMYAAAMVELGGATQRLARVLALAALTALLATACSLSASPSSTPLSADDARAAAIRQFSSSIPMIVVSVKLTTIGAAMLGTGAADPNAPAWAVILSGSFYDATRCAPDDLDPPTCPPHDTTALAVVAVKGGEVWGQRPWPVDAPGSPL
ncbi:MAG: hypothetical protein ACXWWU_06240 [Candidatus Limnocylindria bacterium]